MMSYLVSHGKNCTHKRYRNHNTKRQLLRTKEIIRDSTIHNINNNNSNSNDNNNNNMYSFMASEPVNETKIDKDIGKGKGNRISGEEFT